MSNLFYVKSFEDDFVLKTVIDGKKVSSQSIEEIILSKKIIPNTFSFGKKKRLACSTLHKNYLKTYRSQGLIFQTLVKPSEIYPFDLAVLTQTNKVIVKYYKIKDSLGEYYGKKLIEGYKEFLFNSFDELLSKFSSPKAVWIETNKLRKEFGYASLPISKFKLVEYNETIFDKPIKITPVAIFGYKKESRILAKKFGLKYFKNAKEFYEKYF